VKKVSCEVLTLAKSDSAPLHGARETVGTSDYRSHL